MPQRFARLRPLALLLAVSLTLASGCTRQVPLEPVETRVLRVDWEALNLPKLDQDGLMVQGMVFTPAQWPLEASVKRLLSGDWTGVVAAFDLTFTSSSIPNGVLEDLYERGYVPALVRVANPTADARPFALERLVLELDGRQRWRATAADHVPRALVRVQRRTPVDREVLLRDLAKTVAVIVVAAAIMEGRAVPSNVVTDTAIAAAAGSAYHSDPAGQRPAFVTTVRQAREPLEYGGLSLSEVLLRSEPLPPGTAREGLVFFPVALSPDDWRSAALRVR